MPHSDSGSASSKSQRPRRRGCCLFLFVGMFLCLILVLINLPYSKLLNSELVIDKETFHITEPLLPDGGVDYLSVLNEISSQGATPENNAYVKLLEIIPFWEQPNPQWKFEGEIDRERANRDMATALGIEQLPGSKPIQRSTDFIVEQFLGDSGLSENDFRIRLSNEVPEVLQPWRSDDFPYWAGAVKNVSSQLDVVVAASKMEYYFQPAVNLYFVGESSPVSDAYIQPYSSFFTNESQELRMRAMNCIGEGDVRGAIRDLKTMRRLERLMATRSVGLTFPWGAVAADCEQILISSGKMSSAQLADYNDFLLAEKPQKDLKQVLLSQRMFELWMLQTWQKYGSEYRVKSVFPFGNQTSQRMLFDSADLLETMRLFNRDRDQIESEMAFDDDCKSIANLRKLVVEAYSQYAQEQTMSKRVWNIVKGPKSRGRMLWQQDRMMRFSAAEQLLVRKIRMEAEWELSVLAFGLEMHNREFGTYPSSLDSFEPKNVSQLLHVNSDTNKLSYEFDENGFSVRLTFEQQTSSSKAIEVSVLVDKHNRLAHQKRMMDAARQAAKSKLVDETETANSQ